MESLMNTVSKSRQKKKLMAIQYKGGKCQQCNYNKCIAALVFHHRDPLTKLFSIGDGNTRNWNIIKKELDKCDLLCSNCHAEKHHNSPVSRH